MVGVFYNPVKVLFGWGSMNRLREAVGNRKVLLLTFPQADIAGVYDRLKRFLGKDKSTQWMMVAPELPDINECRGLYRRVRNLTNDNDFCIVAVGGGSVIDTGKVLSLAKSEEDFNSLWTGGAHADLDWLERIPLIAVPTTAGAGSEVTKWATVWDSNNKRKHSIQGRSLWPETAIVDPSLAVTCPKEVTRNCALDALAHALEAIWNLRANPVSDALAVSAARDILTALPTVLAQEDGPAAQDHEETRRCRVALSSASIKAGMAFSNTETALAHALSYRITIDKGIKHGVACSFSLPAVLRLARGKSPDRDAVLDAVFAGLTNLDGASYLEGFLEGVGVSTDIAKYGFKDQEEWERRVALAAAQPRGRNFIGSEDLVHGIMREEVGGGH